MIVRNSFLLALLWFVSSALPAAAGPFRSPAPPVYVALGTNDSLVLNSTDPAHQSMPALLARHLPPHARFLNVVIGHQDIKQALADQVPPALAAHPTLVTIGEFAWVDMLRSTSHADPQSLPSDDLPHFKIDLDSMLAAFQRIHAKVFIANIPNELLIPENMYGGAAEDAPGRAYNAAIAAVAARRGAVVVDIYKATPQMWPHPELFADSVTPNPRGAAVWASIFYRTMHAHGAL